MSKKNMLSLGLLFLSFTSFAQTPRCINYYSKALNSPPLCPEFLEDQRKRREAQNFLDRTTLRTCVLKDAPSSEAHSSIVNCTENSDIPDLLDGKTESGWFAEAMSRLSKNIRELRGTSLKEHATSVLLEKGYRTKDNVVFTKRSLDGLYHSRLPGINDSDRYTAKPDGTTVVLPRPLPSKASSK